jgi:MSHA pilin protein MshD
MFIVIVSVGLAGILLVMNTTTRSSADPMIRKQALAIAESLLEEIELQPFTYCDPTDANFEDATVAALAPTPGGCATTVQGIGPAPADSSRYTLAGVPQFNNVGDYHGFAMNPVMEITNTQVDTLAGYAATVAITNPPAAIAGVPASEILQIDVTVTGPSNTSITLTGYRFRYAPNTP